MFYLYPNMTDSPNNESKFEKLYRKYDALMHYIANDVLKDKQLAEDAVQDAYIKIINHLDDIEDILCHKTRRFIVIVTRSVSFDYYRKNQKEKHLSIDDSGIELVDSLSVDYNYLENLEAEVILNAIKELPGIYADVLMLRCIYEYTDKQLSTILSIPRATVRKRLERARRMLASILHRDGESNEPI